MGETSRYDLRNRSDISILPQRTSIFEKACLPSSINAWNARDNQFRNCQLHESFCYRIKKELTSSIKIPEYYLKGIHACSIFHRRIRKKCSDLHADLFYNHLRDDPLCDCQRDVEDAEHFIFKCPRYNEQILVMFHKTRQIHSLSVSVVLNGNPDLTVENNSVLFDAIQKYIKDTGRFNTCFICLPYHISFSFYFR